ncbi:MAG: response regulator [Sutterella wadsworthensis]
MGLVLLLLLVHHWRVNRLLKRRTAELRAEESARGAAAEALRASQENLALVERAGMASQLAAMFAHEIKQPLTSIANYLTGIRLMMKMGNFDVPKWTEALSAAEHETHRAADIIERVRTVLRKETPGFEPVDVRGLVGEALKHAGHLSEVVDVKTVFPDEEVLVKGDALELELVVVNFLKNAVRAVADLPSRSSIVVEVFCQNEIVEVSVLDEGPAVSDEVFGALGKLTKSVSKEGLGFGLFIASLYCRDASGPSRLCAQNSPGAEGLARASRDCGSSTSTIRNGNMKQVPLIRIVDDDPSVGASFRFVLEAVGYQVRTYESATEFLDGDDPTRGGCMLLDVRMSGLSGPELQTRLAKMKCDLPIIFLTAHGEVRMAVEAVQAGALDFLEKPVDAEALLPLLARGCELHRRRRAVARDLKRAEVLWNELTDAERRTAELVAKGLPNRQAAEILGLSEDTVRSRRASVFGKLELHNAAELSEFLHDMAELKTEAHWWRTAE